MRPRPLWIESDGEYTGFSPEEIAYVNGRGGTFAVHLKSGQRIDFYAKNITVKEFIDIWTDALRDGEDKPSVS